jgi:hypothetical protein
MNEQERELLRSIDQILLEPSVAKEIDRIADEVEAKFSGTTEEALAWETIPLEIYKGKLPESIRSSWVFLLKEGSNSGAERHPNSHQRVRSWRRTGDLQIWIEDRWKSHILLNNFQAPIEDQWASIPVNTWHQAVVAPGQHWIVVSFHTATANELIEERPDPADEKRMQRRIYTEVHS